jgi:hypothetical protein
LNKLNQQIKLSINNVDLISEKSAKQSQYKTPISVRKIGEDIEDKKSNKSYLLT